MICVDVNAVRRHACNVVSCSLDRSVLLSPTRVICVCSVFAGPLTFWLLPCSFRSLVILLVPKEWQPSMHCAHV